MIELLIDSPDRLNEAYDLFNATGINVEKHKVDDNVLLVDDVDAVLIEEVLTEHGIEFQWCGEDD